MDNEEALGQQSNRRKLFILEQLYKAKMQAIIHEGETEDVAIEDLVYSCRQAGFKGFRKIQELTSDSPNRSELTKVTSDVTELRKHFPFIKKVDKCVRWDFDNTPCWTGTTVALGRKRIQESCNGLADTVADILAEMECTSVFFGKGSTCWAIASSFFRKYGGSQLVYTGNLQIVCEAIRRKFGATLTVPHGELDLGGGYYREIEKCSEFKSKSFDVVVTSFMGVDYENGKIVFRGNSDKEIADKLMNLSPDFCDTVIIAIPWSKFGKSGEIVAAQDVLRSDKTYIVVTDVPESPDKSSKEWDVFKQLKAIPNIKICTPKVTVHGQD